MDLSTHNVPSGTLKKNFVQVEEAVFQGVERLCEIIFCIMGTERNDFYEVV
jgi:hypothetical protein